MLRTPITESNVSQHDEFSDANVSTRGIYENAIVAHEEAERLFASLAAQDDNRCRHCNQITSGSNITGAPVLLCDSCLAAWCVEQLGSAVIREAMSIA